MARILPATQGSIAEAAALIERGQIVAFPTETVYGLGANALDSRAVQRIFTAKGRPASNPLIVHTDSVAGIDQLAYYDKRLPPLAEQFWPGPLTVVLHKKPCVPDIVTAGGGTVAIRIPNHPVALALLRSSGLPIAAPSANRSESLSPTLAWHVQTGLGDAIDLILDGGPCEIGIESTVLDISGHVPRILRPGAIAADAIAAVLGCSVTGAAGAAESTGDAVRSPGQMPRHYAPRKPMSLTAADNITDSRTALLAYSPLASLNARIALPPNPREYAAAIYRALHELDCDPTVDAIAVESPPTGAEWDAVRDRLARAAYRE